MKMETLDVISNYPGASVHRWVVGGDGRKLYIDYSDERCFAAGTWHDYAWFFNFGLHNRSDDTIGIEVYVNCRSSEEYSGGKFLLFCSHDSRGPFKPKGHEKTDGYRRYYFAVELAARETVYLSNSCPRNYDGFIESLIERASATSVVRRTVGWTTENQVWVADITYIRIYVRIRNGFVYLAAIVELRYVSGCD